MFNVLHYVQCGAALAYDLRYIKVSLDGRLIVTEVLPGSVADEDAKIEPGDVIVELFNESMRNFPKRKFAALMSDYSNSPVYISIVKCCYNDGSVYRPLWPYLEAVNLSRSVLSSNHLKRMRDVTAEKLQVLGTETEEPLISDSGQHLLKYCGSAEVGTRGTVEYIEDAVICVLERCQEKKLIEMKLAETEVICTARDSGQVVLKHGFPEISSCGRRIDYPKNFAYIAGETTCTMAKKFVCYVFEAKMDDQAKSILQDIAAGFSRTHWAV